MRRRLKSAGLWLLVLALAAGSMALPWMVCRGYDRELFAQPRTRPATDLALSAAARENGFVSQLYERQRLLGGWSEGWQPLEEEAADAAAENVRETLLELMALENLPDGARQTVGEALAQSGQGLAWRDEMGFVRVWLGDVYLITEPVTGLPARLSVYGPADAPANGAAGGMARPAGGGRAARLGRDPNGAGGGDGTALGPGAAAAAGLRRPRDLFAGGSLFFLKRNTPAASRIKAGVTLGAASRQRRQTPCQEKGGCLE